jgi:hypothetical protein
MLFVAQSPHPTCMQRVPLARRAATDNMGSNRNSIFKCQHMLRLAVLGMVERGSATGEVKVWAGLVLAMFQNIQNDNSIGRISME